MPIKFRIIDDIKILLGKRNLYISNVNSYKYEPLIYYECFRTIPYDIHSLSFRILQ